MSQDATPKTDAFASEFGRDVDLYGDGVKIRVIPVVHSKQLERELSAERIQKEQYKQWVHDLQSGMYVNCVYCGHRYGPADKVPSTMADALKEHIERCPQHPLSAERARRERCEQALRELIRDYVSLLELGRDRIISLGGQCDSVEQMEREDFRLKRARAALQENQ